MGENMENQFISTDIFLNQMQFGNSWDSANLVEQISLSGEEIKFDDTNFDNVPALEFSSEVGSMALVPVVESVASSSTSYMPSSVPATQIWPGQFDFNFSFGPQEKNTKAVTWTYSGESNKLYVGKDVPCPINFSLNQPMEGNLQIRVQLQFTSPEYASEVVTRCMSHLHEDSLKGVKCPQHLVRCESAMASYETDPVTKHNSVVVPYENPADGEQFSTYIFKFTCFGSCRGPSKRPLILLLTLEDRGKVVGRQKLGIKICACPGRDRNAEEKEKNKKGGHASVKRQISGGSSDMRELFDWPSDSVPTKKAKMSSSGRYILSVRDAEQYSFLVQMKKIYKMHKAFQSLTPDVKKRILKLAQRNNGTQDSDSAS